MRTVSNDDTETVTNPARGGSPAPGTAELAGPAGGPSVAFTVNGKPVALQEVDPRVTLLDALRNRLGVTGAKKGCDRGQCGACTVHIDGRTALSCLTLVVTVEATDIRTVEGLADGDQLHPLQQAFITQDALQCGFCTPGQLMSALAALQDPVVDSDDEVREFMSGNLCRCAAYPNIVAAIRQAGQAGGTG